jgi:hypothetical protein
MSNPNPTRTVQCYHCRHRFGVSLKTMTTACPGCSRRLTVEDIVIKTAHGVRSIQTCGRLVVQKKGHVIAQTVEAHGGVEVEGVMEANVVSGGPVRIGPKAKWKGNCTAPSLEVELGARIERGYFVIPGDELGLGDLRAEAGAVSGGAGT